MASPPAGTSTDGRDLADPVPGGLPTAGAALAAPSSEVHVVVPALGMDLPVLPLTPRGGAINPPTLTAAYWIEPYGDPVGAGDVVEVSTPGGTVTYTVERTERYDEDALPDATEVWGAVPGRLVLITCRQDGGGRSTENLVVVARS